MCMKTKLYHYLKVNENMFTPLPEKCRLYLNMLDYMYVVNIVIYYLS